MNKSEVISPKRLDQVIAMVPQGRWTNNNTSSEGALNSEPKTIRMPSRRWIFLLAIVCLVAIGISGYLGWVALTSSKVAGCGGGRLFNCGHVIGSRWSLWMGIPVSLLATGLYLSMGSALAIGVSSRFGSSIRRIAWMLVTILALSAGMAAVWFIGLQVLVIKHLCTYCLTAHTCGLAAAGVVLRNRIVGGKTLGLLAIISFVGLAMLIGGQLIGQPPTSYQVETFEPPAEEPELFEFGMPTSPTGAGDKGISDETSMFGPPLDWSRYPVFLFPSSAMLITAQLTQSDVRQDDSRPKSSQATGSSTGSATVSQERRFVVINGGKVKLDVTQVPVVGSPKAKYIFVEMFDYACPHCRNTHATIKGASEKLNGDLAVVALPIPLNATCNNAIQVTDPKFAESCEIARLAVAVWRTDAAKFTEFHNWMFTGESAPSFASAKAHAETLVAADKLAAELASQVPGQYISQNVELYKRSGSGNVPKLMFPGTSVIGEFNSVDGLVDLIHREIK